MIEKISFKNVLFKSQNLSEEKKLPPSRAQIFRYFRTESRNKYATTRPPTQENPKHEILLEISSPPKIHFQMC